MDFITAAKLGSLLAKDYARDVFELLVNYHAISASEVAARLDLHIKTAQDFLEGLADLGIVSREEVLEKKRPYFRYVLEQERIHLDLDLAQVRREPAAGSLRRLLRERENAGARFSAARGEDVINSITIWTGSGRDREERRIKLTSPQGRFLYHLPFPGAGFLPVDEIMRKAGLAQDLTSEILDLVDLLERYGVIEVKTPA